MNEEEFHSLIQKLESKSDAAEAAKKLGDLGDNRAFEPLVVALGKIHDRRFPSIRNEVIEALGKLGDSRAIEVLTSDLNTYADCDFTVNAIVRFGSNAIEGLISALKKSPGSVCLATALGRLKAEGALSVLISAALIENKGAIWALGNIGNSIAIEPLSQLLMQGNPFAAEAIVSIGGQASIQILEKGMNEGRGIVKITSTFALFQRDHKEALNKISDTLEELTATDYKTQEIINTLKREIVLCLLRMKDRRIAKRLCSYIDLFYSSFTEEGVVDVYWKKEWQEARSALIRGGTTFLPTLIDCLERRRKVARELEEIIKEIYVNSSGDLVRTILFTRMNSKYPHSREFLSSLLRSTR